MYRALENNGSAIDEDVEILLYFDKSDLLRIDSRPALEDKYAEYLIKECSLSKIFEINKCADYLSYDDSNKRVLHFNQARENMNFLGINRRDYQEEYAEDFADALVYEIFEKGDMSVVKLKMDYIKHISIMHFLLLFS